MNQRRNFAVAALYVGDLHVDVSEVLLFRKFSTIGPILSIRVCRDMYTQISLGYAYINFEALADAERARETLNFDLILGRPMRIMWSQRNPSLRISGKGNIFMKNLHPDIDSKAIFDTFSAFGNVLSCKVPQWADGTSKGFGFVHFESDEAAKNAISKVNGMLLNGQQVFVSPFIRREERESANRQLANLYVNNLPIMFHEGDLKILFGKFGRISTVRIMRHDSGTSKGYGFVCFKRAEDAEKAIEELNGKRFLGGKPLIVNRAENRAQRQRELRLRSERMKLLNLYVKNLDDDVDDERLHDWFSRFGTITSAKVMMENNRSRGFGFVCFSSVEEAQEAMSVMNGTMKGSKPLYVGIAQRKEERRAHLQRMALLRMQMGPFAQPGMMSGFFLPVFPGPQNFNDQGQISGWTPDPHIWGDSNPAPSPNQLKPEGYPHTHCDSKPAPPPNQLTPEGYPHTQCDSNPSPPPNHLTPWGYPHSQCDSNPAPPPNQLTPLGHPHSQCDTNPALPPNQLTPLGHPHSQCDSNPAPPPNQLTPWGYPHTQCDSIPAPPPNQLTPLGYLHTQSNSNPSPPPNQLTPWGYPHTQCDSNPSPPPNQLASEGYPHTQCDSNPSPPHNQLTPWGYPHSQCDSNPAPPPNQLTPWGYPHTQCDSNRSPPPKQLSRCKMCAIALKHELLFFPYKHDPFTGSYPWHLVNVRDLPEVLGIRRPATAHIVINSQSQEPKIQVLADRLLPFVKRINPDLAEEVTAMLLEIDNAELLHLLNDEESLRAKAEEFVAFLQDTDYKQETMQQG